jgi:hypothetical protein
MRFAHTETEDANRVCCNGLLQQFQTLFFLSIEPVSRLLEKIERRVESDKIAVEFFQNALERTIAG